ncbi:MAG: hypothetical protein K0Q91_1635 [Fibrobacteria bacterium]|jgi:hypothetical protein|nr:hypothetical protein [Fibrobacteria bacterium]
MKRAVLFLMITLGLFAAKARAAAGAPNVQIIDPQNPRFSFQAWPLGETEPLLFVSEIYLDDSGSYVRLDDGAFRIHDASNIRRPRDFDSVHATRYVQKGSPGAAARVWSKPVLAGDRWAFPRVSGPIALYAPVPIGSSYHLMDTGAGLEAYAEAAVRAKISGNAAAARLLAREKSRRALALRMAYIGGGVGAIGLVAALSDTEGVWGSSITLLGLAIVGASWIPHLSVQGHYEDAVRTYNKDVVKRRATGLNF